MTLDEKIGQMTQVDRAYLKSIEDIKTYYLGSLLSGGGSAPEDNSPQGWADMYDDYQSIALQTRLKIPLIYGIDAVHGHNNVEGAVIFPHNIGMGCTRNPELVKQAAQITAAEVSGTGIDWTFSPCIAVALDERWGRTYESFSENAELVSIFSEAEVTGYQGDDLSAPGAILSCAKHFAGDGGTVNGDDQGNTVCDETFLRTVHLPGYQSAINSGVGSVMASFSSWNGVKMHSNKYLLTDVLKTEFGFDGFLVSDWAAIDAIPGDYKSDIEISINAGIDMVMVPDKYIEFITNLKELVNEGKISIERINDAVRRILNIKFKLGLFDKPFTDRSFTTQIGSAEHREVARECVRQSLVLLKNENSFLPLSKTTGKILVAGKSADNLGYQCGGWTISWQGGSGDITTGTTILEAIQNTVSTSTIVNYSEDGTDAENNDLAVVVIGETPYAEFDGDNNNPVISDEDLQTIANVKSAGIPFVIILISGRPLILGNVIDDCDAFVAAWLPGTEGQGVADVLFGDFAPTGKLSFSWAKSVSQIPINFGDANYDPLFPYGFGLTY
ncbi:MAG: glycoside hydrolase family 3 C-terminal domain-containing protein [Ignavibacteriales bacterium]|nr:glycoside hydrolase family 3 C-terminal domain-containing protein [Ignavibacteriales bacterium]